ncbi:MAG: hypothetical protein QM698_08250 [Micropepsaceae bacterium]
MYFWIDFINERLDRFSMLPLAFVTLLGFFVVATAIFEDGSAPKAPQVAAEEQDLMAAAAAVP